MSLPKFVTTNKDGKVLGHYSGHPLWKKQDVPTSNLAVNVWRLRKVGKNQFYALIDKCSNGDKDFAACECIKCQLAVMQMQEAKQ